MHRVMGGNGSMIKWANREPALGFTDHIHFTRRGAAYMGDLFCAALRMHYDYFKFRDRHGLNDEKMKELQQWKENSEFGVQNSELGQDSSASETKGEASPSLPFVGSATKVSEPAEESATPSPRGTPPNTPAQDSSVTKEDAAP